jgi:orotate phosphoribosyltransferase
MDELYAKLYEIGCIKFGEFKLKSGIMSPVYVDFRVLVTYPEVLKMIGEALAQRAKSLHFDRIAGLPYAGLPIATAMSIVGNYPMIYPRKEVKDYGTAKLIEGQFSEGERVLVVDDVITDGGAKIEAIGPLEAAGLKIEDVIIILDREQGGAGILASKGYKLHSLMTLSQALDSLVKQGKVSEDMREKVRTFIAENQFVKK